MPNFLHAKALTKINPTLAVVIASLALSLIAQYGTMLNRDGMLYVMAAEAYMEGGYAAARAYFNWPFLPILMALTSQATGLPPALAGNTINAIFMAGACAFLVDGAKRHQPEIAWWLVITVLSIHGINEYRDELLREYGYWFFTLFAFWLASRWTNAPSLSLALGTQSALVCAAIFRPEALALFPALLAWQIIDAPRDERWKRLITLGTLPTLAGLALILFYISGQLGSGNRLASDLGRLSFARFDAKAQAMAAAFIDYARPNARSILFFGSLALIPIALTKKLGIFLIPTVLLCRSPHFRNCLNKQRLYACGIVATLIVLAIFVTDLQFLAGRYVGLTLFFATPFVATGLWAISERGARWRIALVALATAAMLVNVVATGDPKKQHLEAGLWLRAHAQESTRVYMESGRAAFHAGWRHVPLVTSDARKTLNDMLNNNTYDLYVFETDSKDAATEQWLAASSLTIVEHFRSRGGAAVIIARPKARN